MQALSYYFQNQKDLTADVVNELELILSHHPYYEVARLLYVLGLYQLQDDRFGQQLRTAAFYVSDRRKLFELIEGDNFALHSVQQQHRNPIANSGSANDRTSALIDTFLSTQSLQPRPHRTVVADARTDYMAYLMQIDEEELGDPLGVSDTDNASKSSYQDTIINQFIDNSGGRITLPDDIEEPSNDDDDELADSEEQANGKQDGNSFFTETLAKIYIKQGKYVKAMEIIRRLSLSHPQKNRYFADQLRFLEKLLINQQSKI